MNILRALGKIAGVSFAALFLGLVLYLSCSLAFAQAVPVSRMQSSISGVMQQKMSQRGFAANDPRYAATVNGSAAFIGGVAAAAVVGTITAPAWVSVAIGAGVATVVSYAVSVGIDALVSWYFRPDGKIDQTGKSNLSYDSPGFEAGDDVWGYYDPFITGLRLGGSGHSLANEHYYTDLIRQGVKEPSTPHCFADGTLIYWCGNATALKGYKATISCGRGMQEVLGACQSLTYPLMPVVPPKTGLTPEEAVKQLPQSETSKPLNPAIVAAVADLAWKNAASKPGYDGLPYLANDPITPADVSAWKDANPDRYPTVGDFVAPQSPANSPWTLPSSPTAPTQNPGPAPSTGVNPAASSPLQNLGTDPGIGAPTLEPTPTPQMILAPILDLFPTLKSFAVPSHSSQCPVANFSAFGKQFVVDSHCTMSESIRATLATVMAAVWAMVALFIVLRA